MHKYLHVKLTNASAGKMWVIEIAFENQLIHIPT